MSICAGWLAVAFSFESIVRLPPVEVSARPWLLEGVVTQPCTREVISTSMNWLMVVGVNEATLDPRLGMVGAITVVSLQALVTG